MGLLVYSESSSNIKPQNVLHCDPTARARSAIRREEHRHRHTTRRGNAGSRSWRRRDYRVDSTRRPHPQFPYPLDDMPIDPGLLALERSAQSHAHLPALVPVPEVPAPTGASITLASSDNRDVARAREADAPFYPTNTPPQIIFGATIPTHELNGQPYQQVGSIRARGSDGQLYQLPRTIPSHDLDGQPYQRPRTRHGPNSVDTLPPLRRMSRRNIADELPPRGMRRRRSIRMPPAPEVNGLGDRQRSWTPDSEADQWETFLNTITPDPSLPSASTSFASAAASAPNNGVANSAPLQSTDAQALYRNPVVPRLSEHDNPNTQANSVSPIPQHYMATPESESPGAGEADDNENCDVPQLISPRHTSGTESEVDSIAWRDPILESSQSVDGGAANATRDHRRRAPAQSQDAQLLDMFCPTDFRTITEYGSLHSWFVTNIRDMWSSPVRDPSYSRQQLLDDIGSVVRQIESLAPDVIALTESIRELQEDDEDDDDD